MLQGFLARLVARVIVNQPCQAIVVLAGVAFGGVDRRRRVTRGAIGIVQLVVLDDGAAGGGAEGREDAALGIGQIIGDGGAVLSTRQRKFLIT